jgi:hypothetical protein
MAMNRRGGGSNSDKSYRESLSDAVETEKHELISREPFGKSLGFIEMVLYFYTLQSGLSGLTAAVLLFKAFTGWIGINGEDLSQEVAANTCQTIVRWWADRGRQRFVDPRGDIAKFSA